MPVTLTLPTLRPSCSSNAVHISLSASDRLPHSSPKGQYCLYRRTSQVSKSTPSAFRAPWLASADCPFRANATKPSLSFAQVRHSAVTPHNAPHGNGASFAQQASGQLNACCLVSSECGVDAECESSRGLEGRGFGSSAVCGILRQLGDCCFRNTVERRRCDELPF